MHDEATVKVGNQFEIQTEVYTGPLDLLIDLIERRKLLVNDISLAAVTDDYMKYVASLEERSLRDIADFIVLAATLLLLKSKSLLPVLELTEAEEETVDDLEKRLRHYQIFRGAAQKLTALFGLCPLFERPFKEDRTPLFMPDAFTTKEALRNAIGSVVQNLPKRVEKPKVAVRKVVSLEEMMTNLKDRIERQFKTSFKEFTGGSGERHTVIVGFLAILEMVKQGMVMAHQAERFHDIQIEREGAGVPTYK